MFCFTETHLNGGNYGRVYLAGLGKLYTRRDFGGKRRRAEFIIIHNGWYKLAGGRTLKDYGLSKSELTLFCLQITQPSCSFTGPAL